MQQQTLEALVSCTGKSRFATWALARRVVARRRKRRKGHSACNIYKCPVCGSWHIGGSEALRAKRRA